MYTVLNVATGVYVTQTYATLEEAIKRQIRMDRACGGYCRHRVVKL